MTNVYAHPFADFSAFVADSNAINSATKTALNTALGNIAGLFNPPAGSPAAHPDFAQMPAAAAASINAEITALQAAVTAHA